MPNRSSVVKNWLAGLSVAALAAIWAPDAHSQSMSVTYDNDLITIRCSDATLAQVFEQIKSATGLELILEDAVKGKRLTADFEAQPLNLALERLLAGVGVNYAMIFDRENWQRVDKIFIGEGGGPVASRQPAPTRGSSRRARRRPTPVQDDSPVADEMDNEDPVEDMGEGDNFDNADDGREDDATAQPAAPGFLPPPPAFPRSSATPGLESSPFGAQTGTTQQPGTRPNPAPPAYYPFTDQFGRPIPVPTNPNASQQQEDQKQQEQQ